MTPKRVARKSGEKEGASPPGAPKKAIASRMQGSLAVMPLWGSQDGKLCRAKPEVFRYPLWGDGGEPTPFHVKQGFLCDCYLNCGMMICAQHYGDDLKKCIEEVKTGLFCVTLRTGRNGRGSARKTVTVDNMFYVGKKAAREDLRGRPFYTGTPPDKPALWPMVLEKALAALFSEMASANQPSYDYVDADTDTREGTGKLRGHGHPGRIVEMVAGRPYCLITSFPKSFDYYVGEVQRALQAGRGVCAGTVKKEKIPLEDFGLYGNHQYLVMSTGEDEKGKYLKLLNPHNRDDDDAVQRRRGTSELRTVSKMLRQPSDSIMETGEDERIFKVHEDALRKYFMLISICE